MTLGETLAGKESIPEGVTRYTPVGVEFISSSKQESESEAGSVIEARGKHTPPTHQAVAADGEKNQSTIDKSTYDSLNE
jgi:hypothetical protein